MLKKFCIIFLSFTMLINIALLTSCDALYGKKEETTSVEQTAPDKKEMTVGYWLSEINDKLGRYTYTNDTPYTNVEKTSPYFDAVQTAYEWGVIKDKKVDADAPLTELTALRTTLDAIGIDTSNADDDGIYQYASENGLIDIDSANDSFLTSGTFGTSDNFSTSGEYSTFDSSSTTGEYSTYDNFSTSDSYYEPSYSDTFETFSEPPEFSFSTDTAQSTGFNNGSSDDIFDSDLGSRILDNALNVWSNRDFPDVSDAILNGSNIIGYHSSGKFKPDFSRARIIDENNVITATGNIKFNYNGLVVNGTFSGNNIEFAVNGKVDTGNGVMKLDKSYDINNLKVSYETEIVSNKVNYAYFRLNYNTKESTNSKFSYDTPTSFASDNGKFSAQLKDYVNNTSASYSSEQVKICTIEAEGDRFAGLKLDIFLNIDISGDVSIYVSSENSNGIEYRNGNVGFIKNIKNSVNADCNANAKNYTGISASLISANTKSKIIGVQINSGIGASMSGVAYLVDNERVKHDEFSIRNFNGKITADSILYSGNYSLNGKPLKAETCADLTVYEILQMGAIENGSIREILNKESGQIPRLCTHWEDSRAVPQCTRVFKDSDNTKSGDFTFGDDDFGGNMLNIDTYGFSIGVGDRGNIGIVSVPDGYNIGDIKFESNNTDVAVIDSTGTVTGVSTGSAVIKISTNDGNHSMNCLVSVIG